MADGDGGPCDDEGVAAAAAIDNDVCNLQRPQVGVLHLALRDIFKTQGALDDEGAEWIIDTSAGSPVIPRYLSFVFFFNTSHVTRHTSHFAGHSFAACLSQAKRGLCKCTLLPSLPLLQPLSHTSPLLLRSDPSFTHPAFFHVLTLCSLQLPSVNESSPHLQNPPPLPPSVIDLVKESALR